MKRHRRWRIAPVALSAAMLLVAAGCGDDDDEPSSTAAPATTQPGSTTATSDAPATSTGATSGSSAPGSSTPATDAPATDGPNTPAPQPLAQPATIRVGFGNPGEFLFPLGLAIEMGEFAKENLTVEAVQTQPPTLVPSLAQGDLDIIGLSVSALALNAINEGVPAVYLMNTHHGGTAADTGGIFVRKENLTADGKLDPAKVDGMRVTIGPSGLANIATAIALRDLLASVDKSIADIELVNMAPNTDTLIALTQGALGAAQLLPPFSDDPSVAECCVFLGDRLSAAGRYITTAEAISDRSDVLEAFSRAMLRTIRTYLQGDYHADPEVAAALSKWTGAPVDTVTAGEAPYDFGTELINEVELVVEAQEFWIDAEAEGWTTPILNYKEPIPTEQVVDTSIIDAVNAS